jgi:hypothetical protein
MEPVFAAIKQWDVLEVTRLVELSLMEGGSHTIDPLRTVPAYWNARGESALMLAARYGNPNIVSALLRLPEVRRTINVVNIQRKYEVQVGGHYIPAALHYLIVGWYEQATGISIEWYSQHPHAKHDASLQAEIRRIEPVVQATLEQGVDHPKVLALLLEAGASPFAGSAGYTALHMALEVGMIEAATPMVEAAHCPTLAYASTAFLDPRLELTNLIHAATGARANMMDSCRVMLRTYGARFSTEIYNRGCYWIPRMFA